MADDDNFDIDIYGDGEGMDEDSKAYIKEENEKKVKHEQEDTSNPAPTPIPESVTQPQMNPKPESEEPSTSTLTPSGPSKQEPTKRSSSIDLKPLPQGTKRKGESDERRIDAGATSALLLSDLHWYTTEDDIREWAHDAGAEDELRDITFSEHKVNGKSKGQAFVEFSSPQASTAVKYWVERLASANSNEGPSSARRFQVAFAGAGSNPFKTLPKDAPARAKDERAQRAGSTPYSAPPGQSEGGYRGNSGFRGRGGYVGRGGYQGQNQGGYNQNRNFRGGMQNGGGGGGGGGFNGQGFQPGMGMMNQFAGNGAAGGFNNRGGGGGGGMRGTFNNRGGRGGQGAAPGPMNNAMPMMGMNMAMMGMNPMMTGMGPQGFGNAQFNPAMFGQGQGGANQGMNQMNQMNMNMGMNGGEWGHGPKRQRQD